MFAPAEMPAPEGMMIQYAPFPTELDDLVRRLRYQVGWHFELKHIERDHADTHGGGAGGLTFIGITGDYDGPDHSYRGAMDAYHPDRPRPVYFFFPVPAATFNRASWQRWLFDRLADVDRHEAMEHFGIEQDDGTIVRPYAPTHGPGDDPYVVHDYASDLQRRTAFTGRVNE
jgi:hypothetical protein